MCGQSLAFGQGLVQDFERRTAGGQNVKNVKPQERALFWFECQLFSSSQDKDIYRTADRRVQRQWQKSVLRKNSVSKKNRSGSDDSRFGGWGPVGVSTQKMWIKQCNECFCPPPARTWQFCLFLWFFWCNNNIYIYIKDARAMMMSEWVIDWIEPGALMVLCLWILIRLAYNTAYNVPEQQTCLINTFIGIPTCQVCQDVCRLVRT